ncbi:MAG TPA: hypothetical protein VFQ17_15955 [Nocardioides sp.]|nr:hypothetical protein [Nocardioides sp.]
MSTDLRAALQEAVADAPYDESDLRDVLARGSRRVRRRTALVVGSSALAVAAVIASVVAVTHDPAQEPHPARVVRLDLDQAQPLDLQPTRQGGRDRFLGLTADGLVLRSRHPDGGDGDELGLVDPGTGVTDWLPDATDPTGTLAPPGRHGMPPWLLPVQLAADQLVLLHLEPAIWRSRSSSGTLLVFDRGSRTWESGDVTVPAGLEAHQPPSVGIGLDGRLYLGHWNEGESGPMHWWSYQVPQGGQGRPEPALTGTSIAFGAGVQARADSDGRIVLSTPGEDLLLAEHRPQGCEPPSDPDTAPWPGWVRMAGSRPVVTYWCGEPSPRSDTVTVVYDTDGGRTIQVPGAGLLAADQRHVLLAPPSGTARGMYLLDLDTVTMGKANTSVGPSFLAHIDSQRHNFPVALAAGLILWDNGIAPLP